MAGFQYHTGSIQTINIKCKDIKKIFQISIPHWFYSNKYKMQRYKENISAFQYHTGSIQTKMLTY